MVLSIFRHNGTLKVAECRSVSEKGTENGYQSAGNAEGTVLSMIYA
jgi:hypothetical protein